MQRHHHQVATYTGAYLPPVPAPRGFCQSCCHPASKCCCHRECRKESREVLVEATTMRGDIGKDPALGAAIGRAAMFRGQQAGGLNQFEAAEATKVGVGKGFIGGACCVYLSVEYAPQTPTTASLVAVLVDDSEGTVLAWGKSEQPGAGYRIQECIITTKPGADLTVMVVNATARVRWCEIFSC